MRKKLLDKAIKESTSWIVNSQTENTFGCSRANQIFESDAADTESKPLSNILQSISYEELPFLDFTSVSYKEKGHWIQN